MTYLNPNCTHLYGLRGPLPAMMEDDDWRAVCTDCGRRFDLDDPWVRSVLNAAQGDGCCDYENRDDPTCGHYGAELLEAEGWECLDCGMVLGHSWVGPSGLKAERRTGHKRKPDVYCLHGSTAERRKAQRQQRIDLAVLRGEVDRLGGLDLN